MQLALPQNKYQIIFTTSVGEYNTDTFLLHLNLGRRLINADKSAIE
ncbi:MAG TPA: hypothetical protein VE244_12055 [Nitrososphaeraceae archaeon]|jgi:hypothetical protein|nr:hypothetical protein [Nitrososphaeraceae archaeon]